MELSKLNLAELKDMQAQIATEMRNREKSDMERLVTTSTQSRKFWACR